MPILIITVGISGCGKSTWVREHSQGFLVICPDDIRRKMGDVSNQMFNVEAWKEAKRQIVEALLAGVNVLLDATNLKVKDRALLLDGLPECEKFAKIFEVSPEDACARVRKDIESGRDRANVPDEVIYRMYGEFLYSKKVLESEGFKIY